MSFTSFFQGTPERRYQQSLLGEEQQPLYRQLQQSTQGRGAGGAFGEAGDYYRSLLQNDNETYNQYAEPELRRFREQTIPDLAEQFAGMGSGGLSSSGFRNASVSAGADLSERLAAIRASLRQQGAQGLTNLGQLGLGQYNENILRPATEGFGEQIAPLAGAAIGAYFGGPAGSFAGSRLGSTLNSVFKRSPTESTKGTTNPYGDYSLTKGFAPPNQQNLFNFGNR